MPPDSPVLGPRRICKKESIKKKRESVKGLHLAALPQLERGQ